MRTKQIFIMVVLFFSSNVYAQVLGFVQGPKVCNSLSEVFISQKKKLLFQISVPLNGNFEVRLNPGEYDFTAVNELGCEAKTSFQFKKEQINVTLSLTPGKRMPSMYVDQAGGGMMGVMSPQRSRELSMWPWWNPWAMYQFPMFYNNPCMWNVWGCQSSYYPSGGPIVMGKPNIYIEGPDLENAKIELDKVEHHQLMATAPAHMEKGWTFNLEKNKIIVAGTEYPYLFYDSRAEFNKLSNATHGFCGTPTQVLDEMNNQLEKLKFPKQARKDFAEHWIVKLPRLKELCVYPQMNEQMDSAAPLKISFKDYQMTRALFFIIPKLSRKDLPKAAFLKEMVQRTPAAFMAPEAKSSKSKWKIYEWGVAFPFE